MMELFYIGVARFSHAHHGYFPVTDDIRVSDVDLSMSDNEAFRKLYWQW